MICIEIDSSLGEKLETLPQWIIDGFYEKRIIDGVELVGCVNCNKVFDPKDDRTIMYVICSDKKIRWWHHWFSTTKTTGKEKKSKKVGTCVEIIKKPKKRK